MRVRGRSFFGKQILLESQAKKSHSSGDWRNEFRIASISPALVLLVVMNNSTTETL